MAAETEELHPANLADIASALPADQILALLRALPAPRAADLLEYLDEELRTSLLEEMSSSQAAALVSEMTPDERADTIEELADERADQILSALGSDARGETERLLDFDPNTAGGLMTTEFVAVSQDDTVERALERVRTLARAGRREAMHAIYATDGAGAHPGGAVAARAARGSGGDADRRRGVDRHRAGADDAPTARRWRGSSRSTISWRCRWWTTRSGCSAW